MRRDSLVTEATANATILQGVSAQRCKRRAISVTQPPPTPQNRNYSSPELSKGLTASHQQVLLHHLHPTAAWDEFSSPSHVLGALG